MWIESQDGKTIIKCDNFMINNSNEIVHVTPVGEVCLGRYTDYHEVEKVLNNMKIYLETYLYTGKQSELYKMPQAEW